MSMPDTKRAVYPSSDTARLTLGRHGLNPDVRPYRGTDHIRAQIHEPCMLAVGLNATKQSSTLRWRLQTRALSLDINEEVPHAPAKISGGRATRLRAKCDSCSHPLSLKRSPLAIERAAKRSTVGTRRAAPMVKEVFATESFFVGDTRC